MNAELVKYILGGISAFFLFLVYRAFNQSDERNKELGKTIENINEGMVKTLNTIKEELHEVDKKLLTLELTGGNVLKIQNEALKNRKDIDSMAAKLKEHAGWLEKLRVRYHYCVSEFIRIQRFELEKDGEYYEPGEPPK